MAVALCVFKVCSSFDGLQPLIEQNMVIAPTWEREWGGEGERGKGGRKEGEGRRGKEGGGRKEGEGEGQ